jgi:hypothetical protein
MQLANTWYCRALQGKHGDFDTLSTGLFNCMLDMYTTTVLNRNALQIWFVG